MYVCMYVYVANLGEKSSLQKNEEKRRGVRLSGKQDCLLQRNGFAGKGSSSYGKT